MSLSGNTRHGEKSVAVSQEKVSHRYPPPKV